MKTETKPNIAEKKLVILKKLVDSGKLKSKFALRLLAILNRASGKTFAGKHSRFSASTGTAGVGGGIATVVAHRFHPGRPIAWRPFRPSQPSQVIYRFFYRVRLLRFLSGFVRYTIQQFSLVFPQKQETGRLRRKPRRIRHIQ
jgi:hypothetical protein